MLYFEAGFVVLPGTTSSALLTVGLVTGLGFPACLGHPIKTCRLVRLTVFAVPNISVFNVLDFPCSDDTYR
jgi:hypothetical protein